jgi:hypothetical protein
LLPFEVSHAMVHASKRLAVNHQGHAEARTIRCVFAAQAVDSTVKTAKQLRKFEAHAR